MKILITGGTIDKKYNPLNGQLELNQSYIEDTLKQANCYDEFELQQILLKDSLEMNDVDRNLILDACLKTKAPQIVITHGTDTADKTALTLTKHIKDKTIVITGAMIPYKVKNSDALFNIGSAIIAVQCLPKGVYFTIGGKIFPATNFIKNPKLGKFELLHEL